VGHGHACRGDEPRHDEKAAANAEEAGKGAGEAAKTEDFWRLLTRAGCAGYADIAATAEHQNAHYCHENCEEEEQLLPIHRLAQGRTKERAENACSGIYEGAAPEHIALAGMCDEAGSGIGRD